MSVLRSRLKRIWLLLSFLIPVLGWSQSLPISNIRNLTLHNKQDSFHLSVFPVIPQSFKIINDTTISANDYRLDGSTFIWQPGSLKRTMEDSLSFKVRFRVLPYDLNRWTSHFDSLLYQDGSLRVMEPLSFSPFVSEQPLFSDRGIQYDGSFARGLSVGNRQDLVLNSNFDLRLNGSLGDGIEVLAALSDNSIPLQPEGNTQQLQEFDKIFIQLTKGGNTLIGGDFELSRPNSYFTNYFKKTQGVRIQNVTQLKPDQSLTTAVSLGGSRGKFARLQLSTQEANQGPYRLPGNDGERFIIILAGTEKIYADGALLIRGLERDYIIDYNSGEITFTANRMITKDSRIIAEYEYSDQNYNRSIYTVETDFHSKKLDLHFNAYSEQDGKLSSGLSDLSPEDKRFLADLGDNTGQALASSVRLRPEGYDPNIVMYERMDTLGYTNILVRSINPDSALFTARFTLVGQGNGDYVRGASEANGEVYAWVAPDSSGQSQGAFSPVAQLIAPQQRQLFAAGAGYQIGRDGQFKTEVAMSKVDINRFSDLDAQDDLGYAITNSFVKTFYLQPDSAQSGWQIGTEVQHELLTQTFKALNPYRPAEFSRDWNLLGLDQGQEHLTSASFSLQKPGRFQAQYQHSGFYRKSIYRGNKHLVGMQYNQKGFTVVAKGDWLQSEAGLETGRFSRPKIDISQALDKSHTWLIGAYYEEEKNARRYGPTDTLTPSSFYYDLKRMYIRKSGGESLNAELQYQKRFDYFVNGADFLVGTEADDISLKGRWAQKTRSILDATLTIRNLDIKRSNTQVNKGGLNYVGKVNHQFNLWDGALRTTTAYEVGSGQEPKRTFQFLKVDPGLGVYTFIDQNGDNIQQINEFEIAPFPEQAEYVRVTILTNDFIATNNVSYNQSYSLDPRRIMKNKKAFIAKWSDQGSVRILRKNLQNAGISIWSPFTLNVADTSLVSVSAQMRNVLYFNRSNPKYDVQYEWNDFRNRFVLTTGYESKRLFRHILRSRMNFNQQLSGLVSISGGRNIQDSETFDNKDFDIQSHELQPELTWQPSTSFRLSNKYRWSARENVLSEAR
ncbi:MAG: hypothetical protein IPL46_06915 [Saprospiraceae bacterium]|nr:hypothetical protein [Saprospiraceae bacterium]